MCPKTEARLIKLGTLQARIRAYNEAKATCDKDDVRVTIPRDQLLGDFEDLLEAVEQLAHELRCSNETIDMLYEKSRRYVEQVDKYEAEAKRLQEIVETYDDRFATLNDEKNKEIAWYKERSLEFDEFALAIGYAERPEGQSGVHRMSGPQLVEVWKAREKEIDDLRAEKEFVEREYVVANTSDLTRDALALAIGALKLEVEDLGRRCFVAETALDNAERRYDNLRSKVLTAGADLAAAASAPEDK